MKKFTIILLVILFFESCDLRNFIDAGGGTTGHITAFSFDTSKYELENMVNLYLISHPENSPEIAFKEDSLLISSLKKTRDDYGQVFFYYSVTSKKILWFSYMGTEKEWDLYPQNSVLTLVGFIGEDMKYKFNKDLNEEDKEGIIKIAKAEFIDSLCNRIGCVN